MTSKEANSISIRDYLFKMNIRPRKAKSHYGMYYSPFREETTPSMKVDFTKNLWYDFGSGDGGTMIDLVMKLNNCCFREAMNKLENNEIPNFILPEKSVFNTPCKTILKKVALLKNSALTDYLSERCINIETASRQCSEVYYSIGAKHLFAVGFKNDAGGYELRNKYFKGTVSPKGITTFTVPTDDCMVFEGFMDYLSYLTIKNQLLPQTNTVVLNSAVYIDKAFDFLKNHNVIHTCLDNDCAGKEILSKIKNNCPKINDLSCLYENHKDLNEYLVKSCDKNIFNQLIFNTL